MKTEDEIREYAELLVWKVQRMSVVTTDPARLWDLLSSLSTLFWILEHWNGSDTVAFQKAIDCVDEELQDIRREMQIEKEIILRLRGEETGGFPG